MSFVDWERGTLRISHYCMKLYQINIAKSGTSYNVQQQLSLHILSYLKVQLPEFIFKNFFKRGTLRIGAMSISGDSVS